ncbi:hypothetical protein AMELA_G00164410 [Ameiurus melas]|uniref:Uncharacterized protein n=1 Tax=Ameiurus melas TaxID=219545 RepID=A0A7J6AJN7_AMEME|nr:hypothetical protein AMELA_G00164410 [Ameiurus melas]
MCTYIVLLSKALYTVSHSPIHTHTHTHSTVSPLCYELRYLGVSHYLGAPVDSCISRFQIAQHQGTVPLTQLFLRNVHTPLISLTLIGRLTVSLKHNLRSDVPPNMWCSSVFTLQVTRQDSCRPHMSRYSELRYCREGV